MEPVRSDLYKIALLSRTMRTESLKACILLASVVSITTFPTVQNGKLRLLSPKSSSCTVAVGQQIINSLYSITQGMLRDPVVLYGIRCKQIEIKALTGQRKQQ
jgi:hypothetical protein